MTDRRRLLALLLAATLGAGSGLGLALVRDADPGGTPAAFDDPLDLGVPMVDLDCTGASVIIVASGDSGAALRPALADNADDQVRYLRSADSCPTLWGDPEEAVPAYVAYLGPYDAEAACKERMSEGHRGDVVTRLSAGNEIFVKCACVLPASAAPVLVPGDADTDPVRPVWIRALQGLFADIDLAGRGTFTEADVSGELDAVTQRRVIELQTARAITLPAGSTPGTVTTETWQAVRDRGCGLYDY